MLDSGVSVSEHCVFMFEIAGSPVVGKCVTRKEDHESISQIGSITTIKQKVCQPSSDTVKNANRHLAN